MNGYLVDTNVPSELTNSRPDARVVRWLDEANDEELFLSAISLGEIYKGLVLTPSPRRTVELREWVDVVLRPWFEGRILPVTGPIGARWGVMAGEARLRGQHLTDADGLIAATAAEHGLVVVTRNVRDFEGLGVAVLNPWET